MSLLKERLKEKRVSLTLMVDLLVKEGYTVDIPRMSLIVNGHLQTPKARQITDACYKILERM